MSAPLSSKYTIFGGISLAETPKIQVSSAVAGVPVTIMASIKKKIIGIYFMCLFIRKLLLVIFASETDAVERGLHRNLGVSRPVSIGGHLVPVRPELGVLIPGSPGQREGAQIFDIAVDGHS